MTAKGFISEITNMAQSVKTIAILTVIAVLRIKDVELAGPNCYECAQVAHTRDCRRIVQCGDHESCAASLFIATDGIKYFTTKCQAQTICNGISPGRKRADQEFCNECCNSDYCNTQLCDAPVTMRKRCFTCDDVVHPSDCNLVSSCDADQVCYTEKIFVNKEVRYRLGCTRNNTCSSQSVASVSVVGKRQAPPTLPSIAYCGECCTGAYCNRDLCKNGLQTGPFSLKNPPPDIICQDYDSLACVALNHPRFCDDHNVRNFLCRRTCGFCSGGSYIPGGTSQPQVTTATYPSTTTQAPTVKTTHGSCYDEAPNCNDQTILALVCSVDPKQCSKSCKLCTPGSATAIPTTTQAPTQQHITAAPTQKYVCHDPIPECRCAYLDRELSICSDHDSVDAGNTFCCYYCTKKYSPNSYSCPSQTCDIKEKAEYERVKQENINVVCGHH